MIFAAKEFPDRRRFLKSATIADSLNLLLTTLGDPGVTSSLSVPRDPKLELPLRRFVDGVAEIVNSLLRQGVIVKVDQEDWAIARAGSIVSTRAPLVTDDEDQGYSPGQFWVDETSGVAYVAISVSAGAAVWRQIT